MRPLRGSGFALGQPDAFGAGESRSAHFAPRWARHFPRPPTPLSLQAAREEGRPEMEKAEAMLQTAEQGFKENYALLKKLSEM